MSDLLLRGLDRRGERACLAVCLAMVACYSGVFVWMLYASVRPDQGFPARQEKVRLQQLEHYKMVLGQPVTVTSRRFPVPELQLLSGWSIVEDAGVWSVTAMPQFALALPAVHPPGLALDLQTVIMAAATGRQGIRLFANELAVGEWLLPAGPAQLCAPLPEAVAGSTGPVRLRFQIAHPARPSGEDHRELGLSLHQITVMPGPCASPG